MRKRLNPLCKSLYFRLREIIMFQNRSALIIFSFLFSLSFSVICCKVRQGTSLSFYETQNGRLSFRGGPGEPVSSMTVDYALDERGGIFYSGTISYLSGLGLDFFDQDFKNSYHTAAHFLHSKSYSPKAWPLGEARGIDRLLVTPVKYDEVNDILSLHATINGKRLHQWYDRLYGAALIKVDLRLSQALVEVRKIEIIEPWVINLKGWTLEVFKQKLTQESFAVRNQLLTPTLLGKTSGNSLSAFADVE